MHSSNFSSVELHSLGWMHVVPCAVSRVRRLLFLSQFGRVSSQLSDPSWSSMAALAGVHSAAPRNGHFSPHPCSCLGRSASAVGARPGNNFREMDPAVRDGSYFSAVFVSHFIAQHSHRDVWAGRKERSRRAGEQNQHLCWQHACCWDS